MGTVTRSIALAVALTLVGDFAVGQTAQRSEPTSPTDIFDAAVASPADVRSVFEAYDDAWSSRGLQQFSGNRSAGCPGPSDESPQRTLHIRYIVDHPTNPQGRPTLLYTDIEIPPPGAGEFQFETPLIIEEVVRDDVTWKRSYQTRWWTGADQDWVAEKRAEQARLEEQFMAAQDNNPMQAVALAQQISIIQYEITHSSVQGLNRSVNDVIEVEAPPSAWSFKYDNDTKLGDPLYRRPARVSASDAAGLDAQSLLGVLEPIRRFADATEAGSARTILGYTCQTRRVPNWDAEVCSSDINGESVALWTRIGRTESTAVYLDPAPCVPREFFGPPADVTFDSEW